jgi:TatA/E family protein of Tat protein translocase
MPRSRKHWGRSEPVFSLGGQEILIIVVIVLLLFGPDKIPQLARTIGRFTKEFNKYKDIMESTIRMEISRAEGPTKDEMTIEQRMAKASAASQAIIDKGASVAPDDEDEDREEGDDAPVRAPKVVAATTAVPSADESDEEGEE